MKELAIIFIEDTQSFTRYDIIDRSIDVSKRVLPFSTLIFIIEKGEMLEVILCRTPFSCIRIHTDPMAAKGILKKVLYSRSCAILTENGILSPRRLCKSENNCIVMGLHSDPDKDLIKKLDIYTPITIKLGSVNYLTSSCLLIIGYISLMCKSLQP